MTVVKICVKIWYSKNCLFSPGFSSFLLERNPNEAFDGSKNPCAIIQLFYTTCVSSGGTSGLNWRNPGVPRTLVENYWVRQWPSEMLHKG